VNESLAELARRIGGTVVGDAEQRIDDITAISDATDRSLTFATDARYLREALASRAAAVLTEPGLVESGTQRKPLILVASARSALAALLAEREPPRPQGPARAAGASVADDAVVGERVVVGAQAVVGAGAIVGDDCVLGAGAIVGAGARLGKRCTLHPRAMLLDRCRAGDDVVLQAGAVVGSDGFGYVFVDGGFRKIPQLGDVELGDGVEVGANTCIDRAQTGTTRIGDGTKIDNLVQIGHNCRIGAHVAIAAQTGLAGSTVLGDYVLVGGQSAFKGHITVGSRVTIAGASHVWGDVPDGAFISGRPAHDHRAELRQQVHIRNLDKVYARVDALEQRREGP